MTLNDCLISKQREREGGEGQPPFIWKFHFMDSGRRYGWLWSSSAVVAQRMTYILCAKMHIYIIYSKFIYMHIYNIGIWVYICILNVCMMHYVYVLCACKHTSSKDKQPLKWWLIAVSVGRRVACVCLSVWVVMRLLVRIRCLYVLFYCAVSVYNDIASWAQRTCVTVLNLHDPWYSIIWIFRLCVYACMYVCICM